MEPLSRSIIEKQHMVSEGGFRKIIFLLGKKALVVFNIHRKNYSNKNNHIRGHVHMYVNIYVVFNSKLPPLSVNFPK